MFNKIKFQLYLDKHLTNSQLAPFIEIIHPSRLLIHRNYSPFIESLPYILIPNYLTNSESSPQSSPRQNSKQSQT